MLESTAATNKLRNVVHSVSLPENVGKSSVGSLTDEMWDGSDGVTVLFTVVFAIASLSCARSVS